MESSNINHEYKDNEGNINIPLATSSLERKMLVRTRSVLVVDG
jgi:hypothetical protein